MGVTLATSCSGGESGLVLGEPLPQLEAGSGGIGGGFATAGAAIGGTAVGGTAVGVGGAPDSAGAPDAGPSAGAAGMPTGPNDPPWLAAACTPALDFQNKDTTAQGKLFTDAVPDPSELVTAAAHATCRTLYHSANEVKSVPSISLVVEDSSGVAYTAGNTVHLSTRYLKTLADRGVDLRLEITGIFHFAVSLVYENGGADGDPAPPVWLIVGIADYVRLESGYLDRGARVKGGSYDSSSQATAFFLDYLSTMNQSLVYSLNQRLSPSAPVWNNDVFVSLLGSDLDTLWAAYQATL